MELEGLLPRLQAPATCPYQIWSTSIKTLAREETGWYRRQINWTFQKQVSLRRCRQYVCKREGKGENGRRRGKWEKSPAASCLNGITSEATVLFNISQD